ncbi:MAG: hypothetical protein ACXVCY_11275 [Pseudobdellovibrionaceae bacterium]
MKAVLFFFTFFLFYGLQTYAYPNVGDKVKWEGNISLIDGSTTPVQIVKEVLKYNPQAKKWTVRYQATIGKNTSTEINEVDELYSPEKFKTLLAECTSHGGVLQKFKAPAGTYETCKITTTNSEGVVVEKWWGDIPFGVVSKATKDSRDFKDKKIDPTSLIADL